SEDILKKVVRRREATKSYAQSWISIGDLRTASIQTKVRGHEVRSPHPDNQETNGGLAEVCSLAHGRKVPLSSWFALLQ
ncbi:MAG: hypothetical protein ACK56I_02985, partial [bacterium]